jgi:hypothetical protein
MDIKLHRAKQPMRAEPTLLSEDFGFFTNMKAASSIWARKLKMLITVSKIMF